MHFEELFLKENLDLLKDTLTPKVKFLREVEPHLRSLTIEYPEIFRRTPTSRLKKIRSIHQKIDKPGMSRDAFFKQLGKLNDVVGSRLTIATKDLYPVAQRLLEERLSGFGEIKKTREFEPPNERDADNYLGEHYVLKVEDEPNLRCEIQVRTLSHDLWAVFDHYESYRREEAPQMVGKDLRNLAKLMDVADDYAKTIRLRKIEEAEEQHRSKSLGRAKDEALTYEQFDNILQGRSANESLEGPRISRVEALRVCDVLRNLSEYNVFTAAHLKELIDNDKFKAHIGRRMAELGVVGGQYDEFAILCLCNRQDRQSVKDGNVTIALSALIDGQILTVKAEEDLERELDPNSLS